MTQRTVPARDGYELGVTIHEPEHDPLANVVISAGAGFKMSFYERFATHLADSGFRAVLYDYRGIGESAPESLRGFEASMSVWGQKDLNGVYDWIREKYPDTDLVAFGHSVGCLLIGLSDHVEALDASVFVAPPHAYWGNWPGFHKTWMAGVMYGLIPLSTHLTGYFPGRTVGFGADLPRGVALEWARWCRSKDYLFDHFDERTLESYRQFTAPTLSLSFTDDLYCPRKAVEAALDHYPNAPITKREIAPEDIGVEAIGHMGFFHEKFKESLWSQSREWIEETLQT